MSDDITNDAFALVLELARCDPVVEAVDGDDVTHCALCHAEAPAGTSVLVEDRYVNQHRPGCVWVEARRLERRARGVTDG